MDNFKRLVGVLGEIHRKVGRLDEPGLRALATARVVAGEEAIAVSQETGFYRPGLEKKAAAVSRDGLAGIIPTFVERTSPEKLKRLRQGIAQMLLGAVAERHFEHAARELTGGRRLKIEDHRTQRSDTDYRLLNGDDKPIFRMNIKFHGTLFRQAYEQVGLDPEDCFPLATYKIHSAMEKQKAEDLPYVFFIVTIPGLSAESVGRLIPDDYVWTQGVLGGRLLEELIVELMLTEQHKPTIAPIVDRVSAGQFRVLSVSRAYKILRENLFSRVFALRQRGFNRAFRNAEIDLHISLEHEMTPMSEFLQAVATESTQRLVIQLWDGKY